MNKEELLLKTNDELTEIVNDIMSKIKQLMETDKISPAALNILKIYKR